MKNYVMMTKVEADAPPGTVVPGGALQFVFRRGQVDMPRRGYVYLTSSGWILQIFSFLNCVLTCLGI